MIEWRYCGRFNPKRQDAVPGRAYTWIDEDEAKRRYHDGAKELTIVPPIDEVSGIHPYFIVVTTGAVVSFAVVELIPPGVIAADSRFLPAKDGRLFLAHSEVSQYPPPEQIITRSGMRPIKTAIFDNNEDGTGKVYITEKGEESPVRAKRDDIPVEELYRDVPQWGQWQSLREARRDSEQSQADGEGNRGLQR